jgi:hypothetical protein
MHVISITLHTFSSVLEVDVYYSDFMSVQSYVSYTWSVLARYAVDAISPPRESGPVD